MKPRIGNQCIVIEGDNFKIGAIICNYYKSVQRAIF